MIGGIGFGVTETTFNSLSVISWPSALLVEETEVHRGGTLFHHNSKTNNIEYASSCAVIELISLVLIHTDSLLIDRHMYINVRENRRDN